MTMGRRGYAGLEYLRRATAFLVACRLEDPRGGLWDAADIQWWWREDDFRDPDLQIFFEERNGAPRAMLLLAPSYATFDYELAPGEEATDLGRQVLDTGLAWLEQQPTSATKPGPGFYLEDHHHALRQLAEAHGYRATSGPFVKTFLELPASPEPATLPDGYAIRPIRPTDVVDDRQPVLSTRHTAIERLGQTSLYDPRRHLVVADRDDRAVTEGIYWIEPESRIGLIEPVATDHDHRRRGLARALLTRTLQNMTQQGATIAKVAHDSSNHAAANLYRSLGFRPYTQLHYYTR